MQETMVQIQQKGNKPEIDKERGKIRGAGGHMAIWEATSESSSQ